MPYKSKDSLNSYKHDYYLRNKEKYVEKLKKKREEYRALVAEIRAKSKCEICGENHPACLDFHHEGDKAIEISNAIPHWGKTRLLEEIAKCKILCANCHRKLHYEREACNVPVAKRGIHHD